MVPFTDLVRKLRRSLNSGVEDPPSEYGASRAAVALITRENQGAAEVLVIKRAMRENDHWSGNLALPGGRWEPGDRALLSTAIRETYEEVGIELSESDDILGQLKQIVTRSPMVPRVQVAPFVALAPPEYHVTNRDAGNAAGLILSDEVAHAFWVPIESLASRGRSATYSLEWMGETRMWPGFETEHGVIWGMTEAIISEFLDLVND